MTVETGSRPAKPISSEQRAILAYVAQCPRQGLYGGYNGYVEASAYYSAPHANRPALWGGLVRRGLLDSRKSSEQVRGEPRVFWTCYKITDAGTAALAEGPAA